MVVQCSKGCLGSISGTSITNLYEDESSIDSIYSYVEVYVIHARTLGKLKYFFRNSSNASQTHKQTHRTFNVRNLLTHPTY